MKFLFVFFLAFATVAHGIRSDIQTAVRLGGFVHKNGVDSAEVLVKNVIKGTNVNSNAVCLSVDGADLCVGDKTGLVVRTYAEVVFEDNLIAKLDLLGKLNRRGNKVVAFYGTIDHQKRHVIVKTKGSVVDKIKGIVDNFAEDVVTLSNGGPEMDVNVGDLSKVCVDCSIVKCLEVKSKYVNPLLRNALKSIVDVVNKELERSGILGKLGDDKVGRKV